VTDDELMAQVENTPAAFWELFERHCQSVFRYYAVRANGDLERAREMTAQAFWVALQKSRTFHGEGFIPWLFGIAWDVLNAHRQRANEQKSKDNIQSTATFKAQKLGANPEENRQMLRVLRSVPFYPRETLYLRYFAGLNVCDIASFMDLSEADVRSAVYQGLLLLDSQIVSERRTDFPVGEKLVLVADIYDFYLSDWLRGNTPRVDAPTEAIRATNRLQSMREAVSLHPDMQAALRDRLNRMIHSVPGSSERL
jgi:DNA-directed RNA polymerase specialized sigma24 family protein